MLHIDGHVAGLDQKIPDARRRVLHHQLAGGVVVLRAAVADARQQVIHLVTQPPFGQRHVQHHLAGVLMLHRRHRVQPVQLVQIHRKADGTRPGGELLQQQVVPSALQQRAGQGFEIALKHKAVVVFHLTG